MVPSANVTSLSVALPVFSRMRPWKKPNPRTNSAFSFVCQWSAVILTVIGGAELAGSTGVSGRASVTVFGANSPFQSATLTDDSGRFSFKKLRAGAYTVSVFLPARGGARKTVEVGLGTADSHGRVRLELRLKEG